MAALARVRLGVETPGLCLVLGTRKDVTSDCHGHWRATCYVFIHGMAIALLFRIGRGSLSAAADQNIAQP